MSKMKSTEQDEFSLLSLCEITMEGCSYAEGTGRHSKLHDGYSTLHLPIFNNKKKEPLSRKDLAEFRTNKLNFVSKCAYV